MQENKNLVEEALIQMKNVEEAIAENAKGILRSTMKEEINQLVKESLSEQDDEEEIEVDAEMDTDVEDDETMDTDMESDTEDDNMDDMEDMEDETDVEMDFESDEDMEEPIDLTGASDEEILKIFKAMGEEDGIIVKKDGEDIHIKDNNQDAEYLVKLGEQFDAEADIETPLDEEGDMEMGDMDTMDADASMDTSDQDIDSIVDTLFSEQGDIEDEPDAMDEIVYEIELEDPNDSMMEMDEDDSMMEMNHEGLHMEDEDENETDESYDHKLGVKEAKMTVKPVGKGMGKPNFKFNGETTYKSPKKMKEGPKTMGTGKAKFEYKEGENTDGKMKMVKKGVKKEEAKEAARTYGFGRKEGGAKFRKGITDNRNLKNESLAIELKQLREKNEEYRKALNLFRTKLNEVAIFNSNLAYATRLFTEHTTTKKEKINILRRFDGVESLKESKNLYKTIKDELSDDATPSKSINESVGKIEKVVSTGSATNLIETKTYEAPQFLRIKDLMSKLG